MLRKNILFITIVGAVLLIVLLNITSPATTSPLGLLAIFICAYMLTLGIATHLLYGCSRIIIRFITTFFAPRKPKSPLSFEEAYYYSTILAMTPIMFLGLQSVGALSIQGVLLILVFVIIGCIFIKRRI
jgi:hypothetical protein